MPNVSPKSFLDGRAAFAYVADVSIVVLNSPAWSDDDVRAFLSETTRLSGRTTAPATLSAAYGAMFDSRQRKLVVEWLEQEKIASSPRSALISESALTRGAMTAYAWLTRIEAKAFSLDEAKLACEWISRSLTAKPADVYTAFVACNALVGRARPLQKPA